MCYCIGVQNNEDKVEFEAENNVFQVWEHINQKQLWWDIRFKKLLSFTILDIGLISLMMMDDIKFQLCSLHVGYLTY